jgi:hypothetical protein
MGEAAAIGNLKAIPFSMRAHPKGTCVLAKAGIVVKSPEVHLRPTMNQVSLTKFVQWEKILWGIN